MKKFLGFATVVLMGSSLMAQQEQWKEHINALKEKSDKFNVYLNTQTAFEATDNTANHEMATGFRINQIRLEFRGDLTNKIFYRLRHRLNRNTVAASQDNISRATDMMYVGFRINDKLAITGGKMIQTLGGYEFDENPIYIYEFSDFSNNMYPFMVGGMVTYMPNKNHEFNLNISNSGTHKFRELYSDGNGNPLPGTENIVASNSPLAYIFNWNGNLLEGKLQTRWAVGYQQEAKGYGSTMVTLGTKLNLPKVQMYFDYMMSHEDLDRLQFPNKVVGTNEVLKNVTYNTFIYQASYQPNEKWNLIIKGTYDISKIGDLPVGALDTEREALGYSGTVECMPFEGQDMRFFFTYVGRKYEYKHSTLDNATNRFMLGMIYRIKAF